MFQVIKFSTQSACHSPQIGGRRHSNKEPTDSKVTVNSLNSSSDLVPIIRYASLPLYINMPISRCKRHCRNTEATWPDRN